MQAVQGRMSAVCRAEGGSARRACRALLARAVRAYAVALGLLLSLVPLAHAPAMAADESGFETVRFRQYGVNRGLSQASVRAITQDREGFIWLGTQEGLNRFDGYEFREFLRRPGEPGSLPDNHIMALAPGPGDAVWVGTQNGGLALFDPYSNRAQVWASGSVEAGELAADPVRALLAHRWGGLWVASGEGHLQYLAEPSEPMQSIAPPEGGFGQIFALREAGDGAVLIAAERGVFRIESVGDQAQRLVGGWTGPVRDVAENFDGSIWVASDGDGLWQIRPGEPARRVLGVEQGLPDNNLRALQTDRSGRVWIGSRSGLSRWQLDARRLQVWRGETLGETDALSSNRIESLFEDRDGLLWIGTWLNGVNLHDPGSEAFVTARPVSGNPRSLPAWAVIDVLEHSDNEVWLSLTELNQVLRLDLRRGVVGSLNLPDPASSGPAPQVRALARTRDGHTWLALGRAGLARWRPGAAVEVLRPGGPMDVPDGVVYEIESADNGDLWVGTAGVGLSRLCSGCSRFEHWLEIEGDERSLPGKDVIAIRATEDGSVWVGTRHHGAARLLPDRSGFERYPADSAAAQGLGHPFVTAIFEDAGGELWIGTQGAGLHRVTRDDQGRAVGFERFDRVRGLPAEAIGAIRQDVQGYLWLSTTAGLTRLDPRDGRILNFGEGEGALPSGYFIGSAAQLEDGRMLFGGPRGLSIFDPRDVQPAPAPVGLAISALRELGGAQDSRADLSSIGRWIRDPAAGDQLLLEPGIDDFSLELTALTYAAPEQLQFEYRLEPFEPWRATDARRRFVSYNNLPPGSYLFLARARRPHGEAGGLLSLRVQVPEVDAPWERVAMLAVPASVLLGALLLAVAVQRQREQRMASRRMEESEARLKLALWGTGDEMWDYDLRSNALHRENPLLHVRSSSDELVEDAQVLTRFLHPDDAAHFRAVLAGVIRGDNDVLDVTARVERVGGGYVWLRSRGRVAERDASGRALRITGTTSDISELKESAAALEEANRELESRVEERTAALSGANRDLAGALAELRRAQSQLVEQEKMAALGGLVAGVAHEINTPIGIGVTAASHLEAATRDFIRRFREGQLTRSELQGFLDVAGESADLILRNLERADRLIRSFKQVAVDQGSEDRRQIDLGQYIDEILVAWQPRLRKSSHQVICDIPAGLQIETLPGAIYQVISNLVQNALTHAFAGRDGGGTIRISARAEGERVRLEFSDDGVGMDEAVRQRVFEPFFTTRRGSGGSGLGLHIVYNLVTQALGGSIECKAKPGAGVSFVIELPIV